MSKHSLRPYSLKFEHDEHSDPPCNILHKLSHMAIEKKWQRRENEGGDNALLNWNMWQTNHVYEIKTNPILEPLDFLEDPMI